MISEPEKFRKGLRAACLGAAALWGLALIAGAWADADGAAAARPGLFFLAWIVLPPAAAAGLTLRYGSSWRKLAAVAAGLAAAGAVNSLMTVLGGGQGGEVPVAVSLPMFALPVLGLAGLLAHFLPPEK